jgi:hypothetical protein
LPSVAFEQTDHFRLTRDILNAPAEYWRHLKATRGATD